MTTTRDSVATLTGVLTASQAWSPDTELEGFESLTIELPELPTYNGEPTDSLCTTLVRRHGQRRPSAMLYIHGWDDYFFQRHLADHVAGAGYDFYAVDLHRYGRSLRPGQLAGFTEDLSEYYVDLEHATEVLLAEGHEEILVMGHSTGGLVAVLWADAHPDNVKSVLLNSPWLELQGYPALRSAIHPMMRAAKQLSPTAAFPFVDSGLYRRAISSKEEGVWDYNYNLKGDRAFLIRVGWLSAVMKGHAKVAEGLHIKAPIFMATSARSNFSRRWSEALRSSDIVLDVDRLAERAGRLGDQVTLVRIDGGMHDLSLSDEPARSNYFAAMRRWLTAYG